MHRYGQKYNAVKVSHAGYSFASKLESAVFDLIKTMEAAGEIKLIKCQSHVYLTEAKICMIPDFQCVNMDTGKVFYIEAKGHETSDYRIKRKLWTKYGPGELHVYKGTWKNPKLHEIIIPS